LDSRIAAARSETAFVSNSDFFDARNRAGRELPNVSVIHPGELPLHEDGVHTNAEGQIKLGKVTASAVEEFYKSIE
jgi:lysophospholipase L1-like esterase